MLPTPGPPTGAFPAGTFATGNGSLELKDGGAYTLKVSGFDENGQYSLSGDQVVLKGETCGKLGIENAVYRWSFDGKTLSFKALDDICMNRLSRVDGVNWVKNP